MRHRRYEVKEEIAKLQKDLEVALAELRELGLVLGEVGRRAAVEACMEPAAALARLLLADGRVTDALAVTDEPIGILASKGTWAWAADLAAFRAVRKRYLQYR